MEKEMPPPRKPEGTEKKPEPQIPSPENKETRQEKAENRFPIEAGTHPLKRPEGGLQLVIWNAAERIVLADRKRESLTRLLIENIKSTERLRLAILTLESTIRRLARELYVPLFKLLLRDYGEAFNALVQGKLDARR